MTSRKAKEQLALCLDHLHYPKDSYRISKWHLVSDKGKMDIPIRRIVAIIPAHGTVMAVCKREGGLR